MINRKKIVAVLGALGILCTLNGCNYSYFMVEKNNYSAEASSSEEEDNSYTYINHYQDLSIHFPASWEIVEDKAACVKAATSSGSTLEITRKSGKAAITILPFAEDQGQAANVMTQYYAPMAQTLEDGSVISVQGAVRNFEAYHLSLDDTHTGSSYQFYVDRNDGRVDEFLGVKLGELAYTFVLSADAGMEGEIQEMNEALFKLEFINNPELTAVFLNGRTDIETIDLSPQEIENTRTCIASVNVRNEPNSQTSQVIGSLNSGDRIVVTGEEGSWYQFEYEGKTAYVYKEYFE